MHSYDSNAIDDEQYFDLLYRALVERDPDDAREDELAKEDLKNEG